MKSARLSLAANIEKTRVKFKRENGKRHARLDVLRRREDAASNVEFKKLYQAEADWLDANEIEYSPSARAWVTRDTPRKRVSFEAATREQLEWALGELRFSGLLNKRVQVVLNVLSTTGSATVADILYVHRFLRKLGYVSLTVHDDDNWCAQVSIIAAQ